MSNQFKNNNNIDAVPAAQAVCLDGGNVDPLATATAVANDVEAGGNVLADPLLVAHPSSNTNGPNEKSDDAKKKTDENQPLSGGGGFNMTNPQTNLQWGRFRDDVTDVQYAPANSTAIDDMNTPVATAQLDDRAIRLGFIRKVYSILSAQLLVTFGICAFFALNAAAQQFVTGNFGGLYWSSFIMCFGTLIPLHFYKRTYPTNFILLGVFTVSMATLVGMITTMYAEAGAGDLVLEAVFITASVFIVLTIFTLQTKWDFSFMGAGLGMCLWVMILWGLFGMIFGLQTGIVYGLMGSILFSGFIIYDTYMICERLDPEDYIVAAIELYLDLVNLFLYILQLLGEANRS